MNANLSYMLSRVASVSTQTFKLDPQNSTSATPNQQIRISLPGNTLLNLKSLKLIFKANIIGAASGGRLPAKIDSLIDSIRLEAGGVTIDGSGMSNYGVLKHAKDALMGGSSDILSHPEMVRSISYHKGSANPIVAAAPETYADGDDFCISNFEGFVGSCEPSIIDTALLPDLVLVIQLAGNEVLSKVSGITLGEYIVANSDPATYKLENIRLTCECLGLGSGIYDQLVSRAIAERGSIELPFKQYFTTTDTHAGSTRFHVSSASLDRLWAVFRSQGFDTVGAPVVVAGHKLTGGYISTQAAAWDSANTIAVGATQYDAGGVLGVDSEKYRGKFHNMTFGAANVTAQFQLNGSLTPGFQASIPEWLGMSRSSVDHVGEPDCKTLDQYRTNYSVLCHRMCLPSSGTRELSGTDTRGISLQASLITKNVPANHNVTIFAEVTSVLQIGANKQFAVVV